MVEGHSGDLFASYGSLLDAQLALQNALPYTPPSDTSGLHAEAAAVTADLASMEVNPWLLRSALSYGAMLVESIGGCVSGVQALSIEARAVYRHRLGQVLRFVLDRGIDRPEIAEDPRLHDIQAALGCVAAAESASCQEVQPPVEPESPQETVNYELALKSLRANLAALPPGHEYELTPVQLITLAAPNMAFSRWQRYRLLRRAREELVAEGFTFCYNHKRGEYSAYTVGSPASAAHSTSWPMAG